MTEIISPLAFQLGFAGTGGFIVGYTPRRLSKLILTLVGVLNTSTHLS